MRSGIDITGQADIIVDQMTEWNYDYPDIIALAVMIIDRVFDEAPESIIKFRTIVQAGRVA